jgi:hypothetical protein
VSISLGADRLKGSLLAIAALSAVRFDLISKAALGHYSHFRNGPCKNPDELGLARMQKLPQSLIPGLTGLFPRDKLFA